MALSPEQIQEMRDIEPTYGANDDVRQENSTKTSINLMGPTGIGKNTIARVVVGMKPDEFYEVATITDRARKDNDPEQYLTREDGITSQMLYEEAKAGTLVNFALNTNGYIYATRASSFKGRFNLFPLLPKSLPQIERGGFVRTPSIYFHTSPEGYLENLTQSGRLSYDDIRPRGKEALVSIEWALEHHDSLIFVANERGEHGKLIAAEKVIAIAYGYPIEQDKEQALEDLEGMRAIAHDLAK
jgi:energy-coupling factor transporter ATP-binding protein EcfA2